jgi:predicted metal-dependent phosphoesterase TrpH
MCSLSVYDLHSHSHFSDGQLSPKELVSLAQQRGITHLALTDHDTVDGLQEAEIAARGKLCLIPGLEFSCNWQGQLLHVVGLQVDRDSKALQNGVAINKEKRQMRAELMHEDLNRNGIDVRQAVSELVGEDSVATRPHFAQALIDAGYVKDKRRAFKQFLVRGKPGYIMVQWPELQDVAEWINAAGGVAVLAHPMRYKFTRTRLVRLINDMKECGVDAMEVSTPVTNPQQMSMLSDLCLQHELYASIGSDFHSLDQPWASLGHAAPLSRSLTPVWASFNE